MSIIDGPSFQLRSMRQSINFPLPFNFAFFVKCLSLLLLLLQQNKNLNLNRFLFLEINVFFDNEIRISSNVVNRSEGERSVDYSMAQKLKNLTFLLDQMFFK